LEVIVNILDFGMDVKKAVEAPRFRDLWKPDVIYFERANPIPGSPPALSAKTVNDLKVMGYSRVEEIPPAPDESWSNGAGIQGEAETIMVDSRTGQRLGANDSRKPDSAAAGY
jgi:gamma-glutamyltranspeptidase/glutathione hydrolase